MAGRNESDWSIFSGSFTGRVKDGNKNSILISLSKQWPYVSED